MPITSRYSNIFLWRTLTEYFTICISTLLLLSTKKHNTNKKAEKKLESLNNLWWEYVLDTAWSLWNHWYWHHMYVCKQDSSTQQEVTTMIHHYSCYLTSDGNICVRYSLKSLKSLVLTSYVCMQTRFIYTERSHNNNPPLFMLFDKWWEYVC